MVMLYQSLAPELEFLPNKYKLLIDDSVIITFTLSNDSVNNFLLTLTQNFASKLTAVKIEEKFTKKKIF